MVNLTRRDFLRTMALAAAGAVATQALGPAEVEEVDIVVTGLDAAREIYARKIGAAFDGALGDYAEMLKRDARHPIAYAAVPILDNFGIPAEHIWCRCQIIDVSGAGKEAL